MIIRFARAADRDAIRAAIDAAFGRPPEAGLVETLRASGAAEIELAAESHGAVAGHILLSRLVAPPSSLALAPLSVRPEHQGRGVGAALVERASALAADSGWAAIFVLGDPRYYEPLQFSVAAAARFKSPYSQEHTAARILDRGRFARLSGPLVFPKAFAALE